MKFHSKASLRSCNMNFILNVFPNRQSLICLKNGKKYKNIRKTWMILQFKDKNRMLFIKMSKECTTVNQSMYYGNKYVYKNLISS